MLNFNVKRESFAYFDGTRRLGECRCDVIFIGDSPFIVVFTELLDNPGRSVTNAIESIVPQFCQHANIQPDKVSFIERYESHPDDLDLIDYQPDGTTSWTRLPEDQARPILELL
jgi:hypothetical protein